MPVEPALHHRQGQQERPSASRLDRPQGRYLRRRHDVAAGCEAFAIQTAFASENHYLGRLWSPRFLEIEQEKSRENETVVWCEPPCGLYVAPTNVEGLAISRWLCRSILRPECDHRLLPFL